MSVILLSNIMKARLGGLALETNPALQAEFAKKVDKTAISGSVASTSTTNVASSAAVKSAYDRGTSALNTANTAKTTADTALSSWSNLPNAKSDAVNLASSATLATSAAVKTAYDRGNSAYSLASSAQSKADLAYGRWSNLPNAKSDSVTLNDSNYLATSKAVFTLKGSVDTAQSTANKGVTDAAAAKSHADSLFSNRSDSVTNSSSTTLATSKAVKTAYDKTESSLYYSTSAKATATSTGLSVTGALSVSSTITASSNITAFSDRKLKSNIRNFTRGELVMKDVRGKRYVKDGVEDIGFIAQDVQKYLPELVFEHVNEETGEKTLSLNYIGLIPVLWEVVRTHIFMKEAHNYDNL